MKAMDNNQKDRIMNKFIYLLACTLFVSCQNNNKFVEDLSKPEVIVELAWYRLFGKDTISDISNYWKDTAIRKWPSTSALAGTP